ncbi:MAG: class I SAM-dependent methyltransferase [Bacteroidota bacterium]
MNNLTQNIETSLIKIGFSFINCNVCGSFRKIKIKTDNLREDCTCKKCKSNSRKRHLASIILQTIKDNKFSSLKDISKDFDCKIYNVESNGAIHNYLKHINNYVCSEYFGTYADFGNEKGGILNVDLMDIPFDDSIFDLIISTEVFEHIPNPYKAFNEIHRILKKGGSHIFTVPYYDDRENDEVRSVLNKKNEIMHLLEPQFHGDPIRIEDGVLVYTIFANEMVLKLENSGYKVTIDRKRSLKNGILGNNNIVFITTKI